MADETKTSILKENLQMLAQPDNFQKYFLGTKKNGAPRALYDIVKDYTKPGKGSGKGGKKKHKNKGKDTTYAFYLNLKKHKKKKKKAHWHI